MQVFALCLKHFGKEPESWEDFKRLGAIALWLEERENEKLKALLGVEE